MKEKRARDKARDEAKRAEMAVEAGEETSWQDAMKEWEAWEASESSK